MFVKTLAGGIPEALHAMHVLLHYPDDVRAQPVGCMVYSCLTMHSQQLAQ